ncbi:MAG: hypothetical protein NC236_00995 [Mycoplasma sp.]|nr:hypothetical protein [Mycoplasma sp.]
MRKSLEKLEFEIFTTWDELELIKGNKEMLDRYYELEYRLNVLKDIRNTLERESYSQVEIMNKTLFQLGNNKKSVVERKIFKVELDRKNKIFFSGLFINGKVHAALADIQPNKLYDLMVNPIDKSGNKLKSKEIKFN